jgi:hypothetical protein
VLETRKKENNTFAVFTTDTLIDFDQKKIDPFLPYFVLF